MDIPHTYAEIVNCRESHLKLYRINIDNYMTCLDDGMAMLAYKSARFHEDQAVFWDIAAKLLEL